jgi:hypothetical protein
VDIDLADAHRHRAERPVMATAPADVAPEPLGARRRTPDVPGRLLAAGLTLTLS